MQIVFASNQEEVWRDTMADNDPAIEQEVRQGGEERVEVDPKLFHDLQVALSRLV